jgi:hypothetical protein
MQVSSAFDQLKLFLFHSSIYQHHQQINHITHNQPPTKQLSKQQQQNGSGSGQARVWWGYGQG